MAEDGWHGSLSFGTEVERWSCEDGCSSDEAGGKTKASMLNLSLRPSGVEGLSIGIYHGREFPHDGSKQNIITEFWANQAITDNFSLGGVLASESGDNRFDVGVKAGETIDLGNGFDSHGYGFVKHRFAGDTGGLEGNYFELEPGIGLKLNEAFGGWLNFRYQGWDWDTAADEREWIIKPGVWHHPEGKFDYALWAEIGEFQKAALDYTEDYVKLGLSANYKFTERPGSRDRQATNGASMRMIWRRPRRSDASRSSGSTTPSISKI
jgi:hypothetical protein